MRFFFGIQLHPPHVLVVTLVVMFFGAWLAAVSHGDLDSGLGMLLFVQMFVASTGFAARARTGHFDPMLVTPRRREVVALAHWAASVAPGIAAWVALALFAGALGSPVAWSALAGKRLAALVIVSGLGWVVGFGLPRGGAGVAWLALLLGLAAERGLWMGEVVSRSSSSLVFDMLVALACPFLVLGNQPLLSSTGLLVAVLITCAAVLITCRLSAWMDVTLVEGA